MESVLSSPVLYYELQYIIVGAILFMWFATLDHSKTFGREYKPNHFIYFVFASYFVAALTDPVYVQLAHFKVTNPVFMYLTGMVFFVSLILGSMFWLVFAELEQESFSSKRRINIRAVVISALLAGLFVVTTFITKLVFYVDESGNYVRGKLWYIAFAFIIFYTLYESVRSIRRCIMAKEELMIRRELSIWISSLIYVAAVIIQMVTGWHIAVLGCLSPLICGFSFLVQASSFFRSKTGSMLTISQIAKDQEEYRNQVQLEQLKEAIEKSKTSEVIRNLAEDYVYVGYDDLVSRQLKTYHMSSKIRELISEYPQDMPEVEKLDRLFEELIIEEDYFPMSEILGNQEMIEVLFDGEKISKDFRANLDGAIKYYRLEIAIDRDNPNAIVTGIYCIDEMKRQEMLLAEANDEIRRKEDESRHLAILKNLGGDYECILRVNLNKSAASDTTQIYRPSDLFDRNIEGWNKEKKFTKKLDLLIANIESPAEREEFYNKTRRAVVLSKIEDDNAYYIDVKLTLSGIQYYYQIKFTAERDGDKTRAIIVGIVNIDSEVASRNELIRLEQESIAQQAFTNLFVDTYASAFYVNLEEGSSIIYKCREDLLTKYAPMNNYLEVITSYVNSEVYEDDRAMMYEVTRPQYVKDRLKESGQFSIVYRANEDGDPNYYQMHIVRGHDDEHIAVGFTDVNEEYIKEKRARENLEKNLKIIEEQQVQLEEANRAKTDFLFNMSHDIRTPMNAIIGYTDLAMEHIDEKERISDFLGKIEVSSNHLLKLIDEILDMSRIEVGKIRSEIRAVNVDSALQSMVDMCKEDAIKKDIELDASCVNVVHRDIFADELHVNQILINVLSNAIKYTLPGGRVDFLVSEESAEVDGYAKYVFVIKDNGIGMSEEFQEHIFDAFSRERSSTVSGIQGTGLGMSIVKKLVDYLDGTIEVTSKAEEGTTVIIAIQFRIVEHDNPDNYSPEGKYVSDGKLWGKVILLVEDNEINKEIAAEILTEEGIIVHTASNGLEAVQMLEDKGPDYYDCILMDIQMPIMDGYEATKTIRKQYPDRHIPIVALSANAFAEDRIKSRKVGMDEHIAKPINTKRLFGVLKNVILHE